MTRILIYLLFCFVFISCSSDDSTVDSEVEEPNFYGLEVGNTWEYHYYKRQGNPENPDYVFDGVKSTHEVIGITEINNIEFYEVEINTEGTCVGCPSEGLSLQYLRVEDEKLIDEDGFVHLFVGTNVGEEQLQYTIGDFLNVMITYTGESQFNSDYGNYTNTFVNQIFAIDSGTNEQYLGNDIAHYAEGIGLVYRTCSGVNSPNPSTKQYLVEFTSNL